MTDRSPTTVAYLALFAWDVERWFQSDSYLGLSIAEQGAYMNLCFRAFQRQPTCALPNDDEILWKAAGCSGLEEWLGLRPRVLAAGGWSLGESGWTHPTVAESYAGAADRHCRAVRSGRIAGKASARVRREIAKRKRDGTTVERPLNDRQPRGRSTTVNPPSPSPSPSPSDTPPPTPSSSEEGDARSPGHHGGPCLSKPEVDKAVYRLVAFASQELGYRFERSDRKRLADRLRSGETEAQIQAEYERTRSALEGAEARDGPDNAESRSDDESEAKEEGPA